jgi:uncharacterized DUF497 family protein
MFARPNLMRLPINYNVTTLPIVSTLHFEWDEAKASANLKKHGVSFDEAKSSFYDERAKLINDPDHAENEDRFILLGLSSALKVLVVCHCYRSDRDVIRIISARRATAKETKIYLYEGATCEKNMTSPQREKILTFLN